MSLIFREDDVSGRATVTTDEERVSLLRVCEDVEQR